MVASADTEPQLLVVEVEVWISKMVENAMGRFTFLGLLSDLFMHYIQLMYFRYPDIPMTL